jgi:hypothetical protein
MLCGIRKACGWKCTTEQTRIVDIVSADPRSGVVMPGTGGVYKIRVAASGRGKRGGARVIYWFGGEDVPLFLLAVFAKNERSDLSQTERNNLAKLTSGLIRGYRSGR